jgi:hypothetical protein
LKSHAVKETTENERIGHGKAGPGRPRGSANRVTTDLRTLILEALAGVGGRDYLIAQARENPQSFLSLVARVIPREIAAAVTHQYVVALPSVSASGELWLREIGKAPPLHCETATVGRSLQEQTPGGLLSVASGPVPDPS